MQQSKSVLQLTKQVNLFQMQMRFDGRFGFPGGYVDGGETLEEAVNREIQEELGSTSSPVDITSDDHVVSHFYDVNSENLYLHFFAKKVTLSQFMELEKRPESLPHYGYEVCVFFSSLVLDRIKS